MLALIAPSGAGEESSFLRAGLVPGLRDHGMEGAVITHAR